MFAIVADWDINGCVTRFNTAETEEEAKRLVDRLRGLPPSDARRKEMEAISANETVSKGMQHWASKESVALPADKVAPKTYYAVITSPDPRCDDCLHLGAMWDVDESNKTVSFNLERHLAKVKKGHMRRLRSYRNNLLEESDNHTRIDVWEKKSSEEQVAWTDYRQALRDFPATADLANPIWPTKPGD